MSAEINRNSYEPAYMQLVYLLKQQIGSGVLRAGDQLPSESQLCNHYEVSPMTVRRAINILSGEGVVETIQGRGTFVKAIRLGSATFHLQEFQDIFTDYHTKVSILEARVVQAKHRAAIKLKMLEGEKVIYIRRLLSNEEKPLLYHREYLVYDPERSIVEAELDVTSLKGLFQGECSGEFKRGELSIEATVITEKEAEILRIPAGSPAFILEHVFYDFLEKPVSWGWFLSSGNDLRFTANLGIISDEVKNDSRTK